jgi:DNA-binding response OmpR family regulator
MSTTKRGRILVTDDEPEIREFMQQLLSAEGYEIATACDGSECIRMAMQFNPDLVLMDFKMPKMDGLEATRLLRQQPAARNVRIIIMTTFDTREQLEASIIAGADDFLAKPINLTELQVRVRSIFKVKNMTDEVERLGAYIKSIETLRAQAAL